MSDKLKACPFCAQELVDRDDDFGPCWKHPTKPAACVAYSVSLGDNIEFAQWNSRPIESALESKLKIAVEALEKLKLGFEDDDGIAIEALAKIRASD